MPSTVIRSIAYRPEARELDVLFTTGRRYLFHDVPPEAAEAFRAARIKGRHFNSRIRGRYRFSERRRSGVGGRAFGQAELLRHRAQGLTCTSPLGAM